MNTSLSPWSAPLRLDDIPEEGLDVHLTADAAARREIAALAGLRTLDRLEADFSVARHGLGMRIAGTVRAQVGQECVVTLEPVDNEIAESVDLTLLPDDALAAKTGREAGGPDDFDAPDTLNNGTADLGAIATEFLLLGIDPYPRKAGVSFDPPPAEPGTSPFAALARLKTKRPA